MLNQPLSPKIMIAFIAVCIVWGTTYLGVKVCIDYLPAFMLSGVRHLIAGVIFTIVFLSRGARLPDWKTMRQLFIIGLLFVVGGNGMICWAEKFVSSGLTAVLSAIAPLYIALLSIFFLKDSRITVTLVIGMLISVTGVVIISYPNIHDSINNDFLFGLILILLAEFSWAVGSIFIKVSPMKVDAYLGIGLQMMMGGSVSIVISLLLEKQTGFKPIDVHFVGSLTYLVIAGSLIGYFCYFFLLKRLNAARLSVFIYANTIVAVVVGWVLASESLSLISIGAIGIVMAGVVVVNNEFSRINAAAA